MGDRCYWQAWVHIEDIDVFKKHVSEYVSFEKDRYCSEYVEIPKFNMVYVMDDQVNYGAFSQCEEAAEEGCRFTVEHGPGGQYGPSAFVGYDKQFYLVYQDIDGRFMIACDRETGDPCSAELKHMKEFMSLRNKLLSDFNTPKGMPFYDWEKLLEIQESEKA